MTDRLFAEDAMTTANDSLATTLEREHRQIDEAIEQFMREPSSYEAARSLAAAVALLRRHIYIEEEFVFPALSAGGMVAPIFVMLREHEQIWQRLDALERQIDTGAQAPVTLEICHLLLVQLQHHNMKEERILYPEADHALAVDVAARLADPEQTSMPDRWVCVKARA
jgi:iron-sulfur cluster repair protein YtfE (RIC family)